MLSEMRITHGLVSIFEHRGDETAVWHGDCQCDVDVLIVCDAAAVSGARCRGEPAWVSACVP